MNMSNLAAVPDGSVFRSFALHDAGPVEIRHAGSTLSVLDAKANQACFIFSPTGPANLKVAGKHPAGEQGIRLACAAFEQVFSSRSDLTAVALAGDGWMELLPELARRGLCVTDRNPVTPCRVMADMFWQASELWNASPRAAYPRHDVHDGKTAHPARPPKPTGRLYARFIPWLGGMLSFDVATLDDLPDVHRWMNNPRVNEFWREAGDEARHKHYLESMFSDPHIIPLIGRFDEHAFSYFEIYWAKEDLIGTYCEAGDYDRGCHVIVGEDAFRGRAWFTAWLPSLLHFMFLDDARTQRIVQEPQADHYRQLRNLQRSGFSHIKTVDVPTKRAAIVAISRQHFFSERLWHPAADGKGEVKP
jgi:RimJ/RimL family protein N-acetyltransferase